MIAIRFRTSQIFGNPRPAIVLAIRIALFILLTNFQSSVAMSISRLLPNVFRAAGSTAVANRLLPQRTMVLSCLALFTLTAPLAFSAIVHHSVPCCVAQRILSVEPASRTKLASTLPCDVDPKSLCPSPELTLPLVMCSYPLCGGSLLAA